MLKSGDVVGIACSIKVGSIYLFAEGLDRKTGETVPGMSELNQEDLKILIADLQRFVQD